MGRPKRISPEQVLALTADMMPFLSEDGIPFISWWRNQVYETWPISDVAVVGELKERTFQKHGKLPDKTVVTNVTDQLEYRSYSGKQRYPTYCRVGMRSEQTILDIGNSERNQVVIERGQWTIGSCSDVRFIRPRGMLNLSLPSSQGSIHGLRQFLNVDSDDDFWLLVSFLAAGLTHSSQYPVLILQGMQGCAKSTTSRIIKTLLDPGKPPLRSPPKSEQDLFIAARSCHLVALDNLSGVPPWLSDGLCRISTGGGFSTRQLYSNGGEFTIDLTRPVLINGIDDLSSRGDLASRSIVIHLPQISDSNRRDESTFWVEFNKLSPIILGALLDSVAYGLERRKSIELRSLPRMADFIKTACACLEFFGISNDHALKLFQSNIEETARNSLDVSPLGECIKRFMLNQSYWRGSVSELRGEISSIADQESKRANDWPQSVKAFSIQLERIIPILSKQGIWIKRSRSGVQRTITIMTEGRESESSENTEPIQQGFAL